MWKISKFTAMLMAGMLFVTGCGSSGMESVRENPDAGKCSVVQESVPKAEADLQDSVEERGSIESKDSVPFPVGQAIDSDSFTGTAYLAPMIANDDVYHFPQTNHVTFEPGSRSGWHSHGGMIILVTGGVGYYQEEGKPAQIICKGDVVECTPGVRH